MGEPIIGPEEARAIGNTEALRQRASSLGAAFTGRAETEADTARELGAAIDAHNRVGDKGHTIGTDLSDPMKKATVDLMTAPTSSHDQGGK